MANSKSIGIIVGIVAAIIIAAVLGVNAANFEATPQIEENIEKETSSLEETPNIIESVIAVKNATNFYIDEEGNKKYVVSASDTPEIEG